MASPHKVIRVDMPPQVQYAPPFSFDEKDLLASQLKALCPKKAMMTSWASCCNPQNCNEEADRLAEKIVEVVRKSKTPLSGWFGGTIGNVSKYGRGCQEWAGIIESAYEAAIVYKEKGTKIGQANCFLGGHLVYLALYDPPQKSDLLMTGGITGSIILYRRLFIQHHWFKIFGPEFKVATGNNHQSLGIDIDAWQTGGGSIYPIEKYRADYMEKLHGSR